MTVVMHLTAANTRYSISLMQHYVITYLGIEDPTMEESEALVSAIGKEKILDSSPGMLLIVGDGTILNRIGDQHQNWQISPSVQVKVNPPRK